MITATAVHPGLVAAILAEPEDDALRLVYADWLEEHGEDAWAQFIRAGVAAADSHDMTLNTERLFGLSFLVGTLTAEMRFLWYWERGFVEYIQTTESFWLRYGRAICAAHPVQRLSLLDRHPHQQYPEGPWDWICIPTGEVSGEASCLSTQFFRELLAEQGLESYWHVLDYDSLSSARDALSRAGLAWARAEAAASAVV